MWRLGKNKKEYKGRYFLSCGKREFFLIPVNEKGSVQEFRSWQKAWDKGWRKW